MSNPTMIPTRLCSSHVRLHDYGVAMRRISESFCLGLHWLYAIAIGLVVLGAYRTDAADRAPIPHHRDFHPDPKGVETSGPAWKYLQDGWLVVHIEGTPYERGWQHGQLLSHEIEEYIETLSRIRSQKDPEAAWKDYRRLVDALFLRKYSLECREEMQGIADGAAHGGAKIYGKRPDLLDIAIINSGAEMAFLDDNLKVTPRGLEGERFSHPQYSSRKPHPKSRCSAFAATGPATADGRPVLGHITMSSLEEVAYFNVWLDVAPKEGYRLVFQTSPGGIQSGLDYYINSAGLIIAETTVTQTHFNADGEALASRIRRAVQYAGSIDQAVEILSDRSNGVYTNQWLLGDINTNEIAMFELGTQTHQLWRSSRDEWIGGTRGFYWGCNTSRSPIVMKETAASLKGKPANLVIHPGRRDAKWVELFVDHNGRIGEDFGFLTFTTPPIAGFPSCDAKFTTASLAKDLSSWALFGPPLGQTWDPSPVDRATLATVRPLVSNDWTLLRTTQPRRELPEEKASTPRTKKDDTEEPSVAYDDEHPPAWRGTLVPGKDSDLWLTIGFTEYEHIVALELALEREAAEEGLSEPDRQLIDVAYFQALAQRRSALSRYDDGDSRPAALRSHVSQTAWFDIAKGDGVAVLHAARLELGRTRFCELMDRFGTQFAGKPATTDDYFQVITADLGNTEGLALITKIKSWLESPPHRKERNLWSIYGFEHDLEHTLIVVGTTRDVAGQHEAAHLLQREVARRFSNHAVRSTSDRAITEQELANNHLLLIGRPASNSITQRFANSLPVEFTQGTFSIEKSQYRDPRSGVVVACDHPLNPNRSLVVFAGLSADATWNCVQHGDTDEEPEPQVLLISPSEKLSKRTMTTFGFGNP